MKISKVKTKLAAIILTLAFMVGTLGSPVLAVSPQNAAQSTRNFIITNPYENVNWVTFGQFRAAHHTHTTFSDGSNTRRDMLLDKYAKGFDIVAITDHDTTTSTWDALPGPHSWNNNWNNIGTAVLGALELLAIETGFGTGYALSHGTFRGVRQQANGMIGISYSNEISSHGGFVDADGTVVYRGYHINSFWADVPSNIGSSGGTMHEVIQMVQDAGGLTHLNHPGRYTGAQHNADLSRDPVHVNRHVSLFMEFPSLIGMEIINKWDNETRNDRILWDQVLMQTMPEGRSVWGFSNDDSHSLSGNGHAWNVMLMPELTEAATRISMETGAFYGVSRVDRVHGINTVVNGVNVPGAPAQTTSAAAQYTGGTHNEMALAMLAQPAAPSISNIVVEGNTITISGSDFNRIEWIADGVVVHTDNSIDVSTVAGINSYVRAELVGTYGVAYTQPFGIVLEQHIPVLTTTIFAEDWRESINIRFFLDGVLSELPLENIVFIADGVIVENIRDYTLNIADWQTAISAVFISRTKTPWSEMTVQITAYGQTLTYEYVNNMGQGVAER